MLVCTKKYTDLTFGHRQHAHKGACQHVHGHSWTLELVFGAIVRDECGFVVDFGSLKPIKAYLDEHLDHALVIAGNDPILTAPVLEEWKKRGIAKPYVVPDPSCEGLCIHFHNIFNPMIQSLTKGRAYVMKVTVFEGERDSASYSPEPNN